MFGRRVLRSLAATTAALVVILCYSAQTVAQSTDQDMQNRMRDLQQQIDQLNQQLKQMREDQAKTQQQASSAVQEVSATRKTVDATSKTLSDFMKGFFGTFDMSIDATTKGMDGMLAFPYSCTGPGGTPPCTASTTPKMTPNWGPSPYGRVGWMGMMSSNGSNIGYRGTHRIDGTTLDLVYQVSTALNLAAAPGLQNTCPTMALSKACVPDSPFLRRKFI